MDRMIANKDRWVVTAFSLLALLVGILYAVKPLNADDVYFLHHAWSMVHFGATPYAAYPFPVAPAIFGMVVGGAGLYGALALKILACVISVFLIFKIFDRGGFFYPLIGLVVFYLLLYNRLLDIRPEMLATLISLLVLYLLACFDKRVLESGDWLLFLCIFLLFLLPFVSPRYVVFSAVIGLFILFAGRAGFLKVLFISLLSMCLVLLLVYGLAGFPADGLNTFLQGDTREAIALKNRIRLLFGKNVLVVYLFIFVGMLIAVRHGREMLRPLLLYLAVTGAYFIFSLSLEKMPFRYVAQPTVLLIVAFCYFEFLRPVPYRLDREQVRKAGLLVRFLSIFFVALFSYHLTKDILKEGRAVVTWAASGEGLSCKGLKYGDLIGRYDLNPLEQVCLSSRLCDEFRGYKVFVDSFRTHPICLEDQYSSTYWQGKLDRTELITEFTRAGELFIIQNQEGKGIFLYKTGD
ncbi:hypothetical protein [Azonexus hydrophilus]|uniref:hypothetical protein n=1 Tax=Azonexus hydrophilus TaxID=418702 RepID=UPI00249160BB|nr:hypothetical protein [Azonexus hydrophilus]